MSADLEFLRELFKDPRLHIGIGTIAQLGLSMDKNTLRAQVNLMPEEREVVCEVGWPDAGIISFPEVDDLVLCVFVDGDHQDGYVIKVLTTSDEPIPVFARLGHLVIYARAGKKAYLGSDTKVGIGRPGVEPAEPLVLGTVLVNGLTALINAFLNAAYIVDTPMGNGFLNPDIRTALGQFKTTYLTTSSSNIISQIAFSERGS